MIVAIAPLTAMSKSGTFSTNNFDSDPGHTLTSEGPAMATLPRIISEDDHVVELDDMYERHIIATDASYRTPADGGPGALGADQPRPTMSGW